MAHESTRPKPGRALIGISGWRYAPWRRVFYPEGLIQAKELEYASRIFPTIELNGTFYSLQRPEYFEQWYRATPQNFVFSIKGPRYITHIRRLRGITAPLANFFASGLFNLREKIGPLLWQFPPNFRYDAGLLEEFLALLPRDTAQALTIARGRDSRMHGRCRLAIDARRPLRHAVEIRHESFLDVSFIKLLRKYAIALVVADTAGKWPYREDVTSDFLYLRLHGDKELYASGYSAHALRRWAKRIAAWQSGRQPPDAQLIWEEGRPRKRARDIYCYFDNDIKVKAPLDALALADLLVRGDIAPARRRPSTALPASVTSGSPSWA
jgi:uncharacterized protein YecE (DUF72 family)